MMSRIIRRSSREVKVGNIGVGGTNPVRVQSMTTTPTHDVEATVTQIKQLADAGCEIARVTVQGMREANACEAIKNRLVADGYTIPLVADIHFYPPAAMRVVDFVDKVRVNPGNFVDKRATFKVLEYDDATYAAEIEKIEQKFGPLVDKCKALGRAMRIGTNHGSLSDRIMNRYGDTPAGMVESAFEFARVCRERDYHDFMFSMKASNPKVMLEAYRLLVLEMDKLGWDYPLHLGVTEAGEGEDGRVKSAMGIGGLLLDGIGDTIRVSLTEDSWLEIAPCKELVALSERYMGMGVLQSSKPAPRKVSVTAPLNQDGSVLLRGGAGQHADARVSDTPIVSTDTPVVYPKTLSLLKTEAMTARFAATSLPTDASVVRITEMKGWELLAEQQPDFILLSPPAPRLHNARHFFSWLADHQLEIPVILDFPVANSIEAGAEMGALLVDGLGEGVCMESDQEELGFQLLQAARMRRTKTEFISCPSCGRTLFDLQETTRRIRTKTEHLPGVAIAIMGCIVNGPGEMADADFGYVGSRAGMVDLYVGRECVQRGIPSEEADERLIDLIKEHGKWVESPQLTLS